MKIILKKIIPIALLLPLAIFTGCQSPIAYNPGYLPRTPVTIRNSIKKGDVTVLVDEPLLSATREQGPSTMVGGACRISYPAGKYIKSITESILADALDNNGNIKSNHYTYRVKDIKFTYTITDVSFFHQNGNFYTQAGVTVEITKADGTIVLADTFESDSVKAFDSKFLQENGMEKSFGVAITEALHKAVCKSIEAFIKNEQ